MTAMEPVAGRARILAGPVSAGRERTRGGAPGDIVIMGAGLLSAPAVRALMATKPAAVIVAQPWVTGRFPPRAAIDLLDAGIVLIEGVGDGVLSVPDGAQITIEIAIEGTGEMTGEITGDGIADGGPLGTTQRSQVRARDQEWAGRAVTADQARAAVEAATRDLPVHLAAFTGQFTGELSRNAPMVLEGEDLPVLRVAGVARPFVVIAPGARIDRALRAYIREQRPIVVGVGEGAELARARGLTPRIVLGDLDHVSDPTLRAASQVIVHHPPGITDGSARLQAAGLPHEVVTSSLASEEVAILAARAAGARIVVVASKRTGMLDFLIDAAGPGAMLTRLVAADVVLDARTLSAVYRHGTSAWMAWGTLGVAVAALAAAIWGIPEGREALVGAWEWLTGWATGAAA